MELLIPSEEIQRRLSGKGDWWDLYVEEKRVFSFSIRNGVLENVKSTIERGAGLRLVKGDEVNYVAVGNPDKELYLNMVESILSESRNISAGNRRSALTHREPDYLVVKNAIKVVDELEKTNFVEGTLLFYEEEEKKITVCSNSGLKNDLQKRCFVTVRIIAQNKKRRSTGYESYGVSGRKVTDDELKEVVNKAVNRGIVALNGAEPPLGRMSVVIAGEAGGTMIHEAVGHGFEADHVVRGSSVYAGKLGERIAAECVTVVDDPTVEGERGSYVIDDEGEIGKRVILVENGVLKNYLVDKFWGRKMGVESNGHGRRESFLHLPLPRMSNTYILPGRDSPDEILRAVWSGVYIKKMGGGEVNTTTGDFVFHVLEAHRIERGKVGEPLFQFTVAGNGPKVLMDIEKVGRDFGKSVGNCGKEGQLVPISDGMPTILVRDMLVGGIKVDR